MGTITEIFLSHINTLKQIKKQIMLLRAASEK